MDHSTLETDDKEMDRLFATARRYPLLSATQEAEIDSSKWQAVCDLQAVMLQYAGGQVFVADWLQRLQRQPPQVAGFANRDHHFLLRRELVDYLAGGPAAKNIPPLRAALAAGDIEAARDSIAAMAWPASLTVGLASQLARCNGLQAKCQVADALEAWRRAAEPYAPDNTPYRLQAGARSELQFALSRFHQARETLTLHNLRLVYVIARKYTGQGIPYRDLVQEGTLGLIRAIEKFEANKGYRFSTYCYNWIAQSVRRHVNDSAALIRYPTHVREQVSRLHREHGTLLARTGAAPSTDELATAAGLATDKTRELRQLRNFSVSLDAPRHDDEDDTLLDSIAGGPFGEAGATAESASLQRCLLRELDTLEPAEKQVVIARWGLHRGPPLSRAEIADKMAVSREWVRQLERSALDKLSHNRVVRTVARDHGAFSAA